jgi:hypothetical protein
LGVLLRVWEGRTGCNAAYSRSRPRFVPAFGPQDASNVWIKTFGRGLSEG